jgi:hypothetical protein
VIFLIEPGSFDHFRVQNFLPPMEALDIGAIIEVLGYPFPVLAAISVY